MKAAVPASLYFSPAGSTTEEHEMGRSLDLTSVLVSFPIAGNTMLDTYNLREEKFNSVQNLGYSIHIR